MKQLYTMCRRRIVCLLVLLMPIILSVTAQQVQVSLAGTSVTNSGGYYEYVPFSYASSKDSFPLLIFIHGIGELGDGTTQLYSVLKNGVPKLINNGTFPASFTVNGKTFSFIVASPQFRTSPSPVDIRSLINYLKGKFRIDNKRIYVTGLSMGGGATEDFASANDEFAQIPAAVVAVAGNMNPKVMTNAPNIAARNDMPMWFLHNESDPTVPSQYSKDWVSMMDAYTPSPSPEPRLTIFNASGHDAWTKAYDPAYKENGMNVYEWMLQYEKGSKVVTPPPPPAGNKRVTARNNIGNGMYYPDAMTTFGLKPGDTLCIPAGDYEFIQLGKLVGTAAKPVVVTNCGGQVRIGIKTLKSDVAFNFMSNQYVEVSGAGTPGIEYGFDVNGKNLNNVQMMGMYLGVGSTDMQVHHIYFHDVSHFIVAKTTQQCDNPQYWEGKFVMKNVKIYHIKGRYALYEGFYIGNTHYVMNYATCTGIKSHHVQDLEVYDNDLQYMGNDGIQVAMADLGENRIHHNKVRNYGTNKEDGQSYGLLMGGGSRVKVYNNVVDNGYLPGIALFGSGISYVYNNTLSNITNGEGITVADKLILEPVTAYIFNNTIYNTGNTGIKIYAYLTTLGHKVYNNLVIENTFGGSYPQTGYYIRGNSTIKFDFSNNQYSTTADAGKWVTNVTGGNFHLISSSPAIDAGKTITDIPFTKDLDDATRPVNGKYDIGAYEYQGTGTPPKANVPPVANAGTDITITLPVNTVVLDGRASSDTDGTITQCFWQQVSGPGKSSIVSPSASSTNVTGLIAGTYVFSLTVTDNDKATDTDQVTVVVKPVPAPANIPPVANAGSNVTITLPQNSVILNGKASSDPDGTITSYYWHKITGKDVHFSNISGMLNVVSGLVEGTYVFELVVTDNKNATGTDRITVTVLPSKVAGVAPVVITQGDLTIQLPVDYFTADGSKSYAPSSNLISWQWKQLSGPLLTTIVSPGAKNTRITGLGFPGVYVFQLTVMNSNQVSSIGTFGITVLNSEDDFIPEITIYPNPATSVLYFKQRLKNATEGQITIYTLAGKVMKTYVIPAADIQQQDLNISSLPNGMYVLEVRYKRTTYKMSFKFIKAS